MIKVIIIGGSSLAGKGIINQYERYGQPDRYRLHITVRKGLLTPLGPDYVHYMDLTDSSAVENVISRVKPGVIVYIASEGRVDYCEKNRAEAKLVNIDSLNGFIDVIEKYPCSLLYLSTNAVFDGAGAPYGETALPNPINYYGITKLEAEKIVSGRLKNRSTIIRPTLLMGLSGEGRRKSSLEFFLSSLRRGEKIRVVDDIFTNPLHTNFLGGGIWKIIENPDSSKNEIFHFGGKERLSRYHLVLEACRYFGIDTGLVERVDSSAFPGIARRMPDTTFNTYKAETVLGWKPPFISESLKELRMEIEEMR